MPMSEWCNADLSGARIVVIDDNQANLRLAEEFLLMAGYTDIRLISESAFAADYILDEEPDLVLLDLRMPIVSGFDILEEVSRRRHPSTFIPILVLSADFTPAARQKALDLGAHDFVSKPFDMTELQLRVRNFLHMRWMHQSLLHEKMALEERVQLRTRDLIVAREEGVACLARAIEYRDDCTGEHTRRVGNMSAELAVELGLDLEEVELIRLSAPLHDLGKIGVPDHILLKPGKLTDPEFALMQMHAVLGSTIVAECTSPLLQMIGEIALHHHERWNGRGYPDGLSCEDIPISCRIVAVADTYDALTNERPYKPAWPREKAVEEICAKSGIDFDPWVVEAFRRLYG